MNSLLSKSTGLIARSTKQLYYTPVASLHVSSMAQESVIDKAKSVAQNINKTIGKKASDAIEGAESATKTVPKKAKGLKNEAVKSADNVNKAVGKKAGEAIEGAENATSSASEKAGELKKEATLDTKKAKKAAEEKTEHAIKYSQEKKDEATDAAKDIAKKAKQTVN